MTQERTEPSATRALVGRASRKIRSRTRDWYELHIVRPAALTALVRQTANFSNVHFLGKPLWQNITDIWALQEAITDWNIDLVVECGTNRGGSAFFIASMFDLLDRGRIITVDIENLMTFTHPRIEFVHGSSTDPKIVEQVRSRVAEIAPENVLVLLDSDHAEEHVIGELRQYADLVKVGGYVVVQDTVIDELKVFSDSRPGPLGAVKRFLKEDKRFEVDRSRSTRFLFNHSPSGWLRRVG